MTACTVLFISRLLVIYKDHSLAEKKMEFCLKLLIILFLLCNSALSEDAPIVTTRVGKIIGTVKKVQVDGKQMEVYRYLGIPYAEAPVGKLRFKKTVPKGAFKSVFNATRLGRACLQVMSLSVPEDTDIRFGEDCLNLNVYIPGGNRGNRAVMVWIHGDGFVSGSSDQYLSDTLSANDKVIVVTINYRLSLWGFLSTGDAHAPGNYGLWDQHLALKWVHDNIENFGGDAAKVTLFGGSAGLASVVYQSLFAGNKGLFQRAIGATGSISIPRASGKKSRQDIELFGKLVDCDILKSGLLVDCIRNKSPDILNAALNNFTNGFLRFDKPFLPTVDGDFVKEESRHFINGDSKLSPADLDVFTSVDFMCGVNAGEGLAIINPFLGIENPEHFELNQTLEKQLSSMVLQYELGESIPEVVKGIVSHGYTDWTEPDSMEKRKSQLVKLYSDIFFAVPLIKTISLHHSLTKNIKSTYVYMFDILSSGHGEPAPSRSNIATYGDDLEQVFFQEINGFTSLISGNEKLGSKDRDSYRARSKYLQTMLINFVKTGYV